jgi:hypothetical protein
MQSMKLNPRQEALKLAVHEARRFIAKADKAYDALDNPMADFHCPEYAAAKRASMDLTKALPKVRNPHTF